MTDAKQASIWVTIITGIISFIAGGLAAHFHTIALLDERIDRAELRVVKVELMVIGSVGGYGPIPPHHGADTEENTE